MRNTVLPHEERSHAAGTAQRRNPHALAGQRHVRRIRCRQEQPAETERGKCQRRHVQHSAGAAIPLLAHQQSAGQREQHQGADKQPVEAAPAPGVYERAADDGPDVGGEPHGNAGNAHGRARALSRKARHGQRLHERQRDARSHRLQHTSQHKREEGSGNQINGRARQKEPEGQTHQALDRHTPGEERHHRHRNTHNEHVDRGQPLPLAGIDEKLRANAREHGVRSGLGKRS